MNWITQNYILQQNCCRSIIRIYQHITSFLIKCHLFNEDLCCIEAIVMCFKVFWGGTITLVCNYMLRQFTGRHTCMSTVRLVVEPNVIVNK